MRSVLMVLVDLYLVGCAIIRTLNTEVWEKDGQTYVIFLESPAALYYAYRPLACPDGALMSIRFLCAKNGLFGSK